ncbi:30S ribosomal protein S17e [Candidatus Woesearchaeota archaeon]|jgi:small subunit ribosomal protein S17e|nr:30S ribosomal protein S17e [Candidatus Woesearchaeota archaeon]MBT7368588.1 30S ribosomal protein S17e [Candidatus Woesearchaeota archaeon]
MGRIKTMLVKRTAKDVIKKHPEAFSADFEKNKVILDNLTDISSKKLRNVIAGYVSRLIKTREEL